MFINTIWKLQKISLMIIHLLFCDFNYISLRYPTFGIHNVLDVQ